MDNNEKYEVKNFIEINLARPLNCGDFLISRHEYFDGKDFSFCQSSDTVLKVFDEILTNAVDSVSKGFSSKIFVEFKDETLVVKNNGGINIYEDNGIYSVEKIFSHEYSSSNYDNKGTTGGLNGIGAKLTNIYSQFFQVETQNNGLNFKQIFRKNMKEKENPQILKVKNKDCFTIITFIPDWDKCVRHSIDQFTKNWIGESRKFLENIYRERCLETAVYLEKIILFNNDVLSPNLADFCGRFGEDFVCDIFEELRFGIIFQKKCFRHVSVINGLRMKLLPNYCDCVLKKLEEIIFNSQIYKMYFPDSLKISSKIFRKNIYFVSFMKLCRSKIAVNSNEKTTVFLTRAELNRFEKNIKIPEKIKKKVLENAEFYIKKNFKISNKDVKIPPKFYIKAMKLPGKALFIVEGNSAATLIQTIIAKNKNLSKKDYGIFSTGGVPMNSLKNGTEINGEIIQNKKMQNNITFQSLVNVLGLSYSEDKKPHYDCVIFATDQDMDGIGKICGLLITFFAVYFPDLVKTGFLKRLRTPLARVYKTGIKIKQTNPKKIAVPVAEYYNETDEMIKGETFYFKGLGSHDPCEVNLIAENFWNNIVNINWDKDAAKSVQILYGKNVVIRKKNLLKETLSVYKDPLNVSITEHLQIDSKAEQLANIVRMTPHVIDGLKPSIRKAFAVARKMQNKIITTSALAGKVLGEMNYNHGEVPMQNVIHGCASNISGINVDPLLTWNSLAIGSLRAGMNDVAAARYTKVSYNNLMNIYFPLEDDCLLNYTKQEGEIYEPDYYVPIIPRVLVETNNSTGTGWSHCFFGRNREHIIKVVETAINTYPDIYCSDMYGFINDLNGNRIAFSENQELSFGTVIENRTKDTIQIKVLPINLWSLTIVNSIKKKPIVKEVYDHTAEEADITIKLLPNSWKILDKFETKYCSGAEKYFGIRTILHRNLNFVFKNKIREFNGVREMFVLWFEERKKLYEKRINRQQIILKYKIILAESIYFYLTNHSEKVRKWPLKEIDEFLEKAETIWTNEEKSKYFRIKSEVLDSKKPIDDIEKEILSGNFNYIHDLKESSGNKESLEKLLKKIRKLHETKILSWNELWLSEIDFLSKK